MLKQPQPNIFHTIIKQDQTLFEAGLFERILQFRYTDYKSMNGQDVYTGSMSRLSPKMVDQFDSLEYVLEFMNVHKTVRFDRGKQNIGIILIYQINGVIIDEYETVSLQKANQIHSSHCLQQIIHTCKQQPSFDHHTIKQYFQILANELQTLKQRKRESQIMLMSKQNEKVMEKQCNISYDKRINQEERNEYQQIIGEQLKQQANPSYQLSDSTIQTMIKQMDTKYQQQFTLFKQQIANIHFINNTFINNTQHLIKTTNNRINKLTNKVKAQANKYKKHFKTIYNQSISAINRQANSFKTCIQQNQTKYKHQIERHKQQFQTNHQNYENQLNSLKNSVDLINKNIHESQKDGQQNSLCSHKQEIDLIQKDIKSMKKVIRQQFQCSIKITDSMYAQIKTKTENQTIKHRKDDRKS